MRKNNLPGATEAQEQAAVIQWAMLRSGCQPALKMLNASLNGVRLTTYHQRGQAHRTGMRAGFPDLALPVARRGYHGLFIEMKRADGIPSDLEDQQAAWLNALLTHGNYAAVCYGAEDAIFLLEWYLKKTKGEQMETGEWGAYSLNGGFFLLL